MNIPFSITSDEDFTRLLEDPLFLRMLDALSIGISITDPTGTVRYLSKSCYEIYGMDPSESAVGKKIDELFRTGKAGVLSSLATRRVNTVASISYNGIEALCRRYPIVDDAGNLVCCVSEVIATTHENSRIDELLRSLQQLKRKSGYFMSQEPTHGGWLRTFEDLVGDTSAMQELKKMGVRFARSREPVLILGESGTGKELFAQAIHRASPRANGSFVSVNCAALPRELAESELFGYVEGAFTGAKKGGKKGKFELANNGTIFLDEIGELPLHLQAKLLRVLESNEIQKIGMGESERERIEVALAIRVTGALSVPRSVLKPIPGTRLEKALPLSDRDVLRAAALMQIVNPDASVRLAGGRSRIKHLEPELFRCGVSASIVGDLLTTSGSDIDTDKAMFKKWGFGI